MPRKTKIESSTMKKTTSTANKERTVARNKLNEYLTNPLPKVCESAPRFERIGNLVVNIDEVAAIEYLGLSAIVRLKNKHSTIQPCTPEEFEQFAAKFVSKES